MTAVTLEPVPLRKRGVGKIVGYVVPGTTEPGTGSVVLFS